MPTTSVTRRRVGRAAALVTAAATVTGTWGLASAASTATTGGQAAPQPAATAARPEPTATAIAPAPVLGTRFARTELYFGTDRKNDPDVTEHQFNRFVDEVVTPRFPDGLTQMKGAGQFLGSTGPIEENSYVIVLLYPLDDTSAHREIEYIRRAYKEAFDQESVLRADSVDRVSF
jgi:hypothetical protein